MDQIKCSIFNLKLEKDEALANTQMFMNFQMEMMKQQREINGENYYPGLLHLFNNKFYS